MDKQALGLFTAGQFSVEIIVVGLFAIKPFFVGRFSRRKDGVTVFRNILVLARHLCVYCLCYVYRTVKPGRIRVVTDIFE